MNKESIDEDKNEKSPYINTKEDLYTTMSVYPISTQHREKDNSKATVNEKDMNGSGKKRNQ